MSNVVMRLVPCLMAAGMAAIPLLAADRGPAAPAVEKAPPWRLAVQVYTFNRFTLLEAIDKAKAVGVRYIEAFSWQKVGPELGDVQFNQDAPAEVLDRVKRKLAEADVKLVALYVGDLGKDEAATRKVLDFARRMGIETIVCEPPPAALDLLDKLTVEYGVNVVIHNHPKDAKHPDYRNWNPDEVLKLVKDRNKRIGACADTGHWVRSGLDPVQALKTYKGRVISLHLKDVDKAAPEGHDVPFGTGVGNVKAVLAELQRQGFTGIISIEYEANMENNMPDVTRSVKFFNEAARDLGR